MYTVADAKNIFIDILGTFGSWILNHMDLIVWTCVVLLIFYCGMWVERMRFEREHSMSEKLRFERKAKARSKK